MIADLLAERIAVEAEHMGGLDLVAARGRQAERDQGDFQLAQHAVIQARRRQIVALGGKILGQMPLDAAGQRLFLARLGIARRLWRFGQTSSA
jgi:hypothetical protein